VGRPDLKVLFSSCAENAVLGKGDQEREMSVMTAVSVEAMAVRTPCVLIDRFKIGLKRQMIVDQGDRPKFRCGVMAVARSGGKVAIGDLIEIKYPSEPWRPLPPL
jgi:MOSC domain-containing protein YiiM